jgi:hyperosmotically inducible protein
MTSRRLTQRKENAMKKPTAALVSMMFALFLSACASSPTSRTTGQVIDDAATTTRVKAQLAQTQGLGEAVSINVDTYRDVVSLAGFVNTEEQRREAARAAMKVPGVQKVFNNLIVKPTSAGN